MPNARTYDDRQREAVLALADSGVSSPEISRRLAAGEGPVPPVDIPERTVRRIVLEQRRDLERQASRLGGSGGRAQPAPASRERLQQAVRDWMGYAGELIRRGWKEYVVPMPRRPDEWKGRAHELRDAEARATRTTETDLGAASPHQ